MDTIAIIIASLSIVIAALTFYFTQLQAPKLTALIGPSFNFYYADYSSGGSSAMYLPVTFINRSTKTGTITNVAIRIYKKDLPEQSYLMQWREFSKLDPEESIWVYEEMAHALAIPGKSTINKIIWFMWGADSKPKLILQKGAYKIDFYYWEQPNKPPHLETHGFVISDSIYDKFEQFRSGKSKTVIPIRLDKQIEQNRFMTEHEVQRLLGK